MRLQTVFNPALHDIRMLDGSELPPDNMAIIEADCLEAALPALYRALLTAPVNVALWQGNGKRKGALREGAEPMRTALRTAFSKAYYEGFRNQTGIVEEGIEIRSPAQTRDTARDGTRLRVLDCQKGAGPIFLGLQDVRLTVALTQDCESKERCQMIFPSGIKGTAARSTPLTLWQAPEGAVVATPLTGWPHPPTLQGWLGPKANEPAGGLVVEHMIRSPSF